MTFQSGDVVQVSGQTINTNIVSGALFIYGKAVSSQVITIVSGMYINSGQYQISGQYLSSGQAITNVVAGSGAVSIQVSGTVAQINVSGGGGAASGQITAWCRVYSDTLINPIKDLTVYGNSEATMFQRAGSGQLCQWQTSGTCSGITATVGTSGRFLFTINASGVYYAIARATQVNGNYAIMSFQKSGVELADSVTWIPSQIGGGPPAPFHPLIVNSFFRAIPGETIKWFFSGFASNQPTYTPAMTVYRIGD